MEKSSLDISCHSSLTAKKHHPKLGVSKGDSRVCKTRAIPSFCKQLPKDGKVKGTPPVWSEIEKEGRVHGGLSVLEIALKAEKEGLLDPNGRVYSPDPLETCLGETNLPEGRVHGGNLLALIEGLSN